jgi:carbon-monoxide dehydrogenase small subunit
MTVAVRFEINGREVALEVDDDELLCTSLRERLDLTGTRVGCHEGVCGSCDVFVEGAVVRSCLMLTAQLEGRHVVTVEGLGATDELSPLQQAFVDHGAVQCGFCTSGLLVSATDLLARNPRPSEAEIVRALAGNLCRCTGYTKVVEAVRAVSVAGPSHG